MDDSIQLTGALLGVFVGALMGLTGAGGGILSVPLLMFALQLNLAQASPVALAAIATASAVGAGLGLKEKILRYRAAGLMALTGLLLAPLGLWLSQHLPNRPLVIIFAVILFYVSTRLFLQAYQEIRGYLVHARHPPPCLLDQTRGKLKWTLPCARALVCAGASAGFLSGLLGVGGGFIIVPALKRYTDLPVNSIVATSLGVLTIITGGSAILSAASGNMSWPIAIPFVGGAVLGMLIGKVLGTKISGPRLQQVFAVFSFCVALSLVYKTLQP
jgi:hypothetical protein